MPEGLLAGFAYIEIVPELKKFAAEAKAEVTKAAKETEASASKAFAGVGKAALLGIAGAAAGIAAESIHLADGFEEAHARLEVALKNTGESFAAVEPKVDGLDKKLEKLGFSNTDVQSGFAQLQAATKNSAKTLTDMALAADIARGRHISLQAATDILTKVETGHVALLGRIGVNTKDATGKTIDQETALKRLSALYGGQAQAYAGTFAGKMQTLKTEVQDLGVKIGLKLIPIIESLVSKITGAITWFEKHRTVAIALGVAVGSVLVAAIAAYVVSMAAAAVATIAATWPILAIIAAVAAVGVGIYLLATHWHQVWSDIKAWIADAVAWIKHHTGLIIALFGPLGVAVEVLAHNWKSIWHDIQTVVEDVWKVLKPIFEAIASAAKEVVRITGDVAKVAGGIGKTVGGVLSHIPGFDDGGRVPGPVGAAQLAVVHGGEFVVSNDMQRAAAGLPLPLGNDGANLRPLVLAIHYPNGLVQQVDTGLRAQQKARA